MSNFDPREFRNALGRFATGVTVVTTVDDAGKYYGVTANSYNSVSLDPPLILWSLATRAGSFPAFERAEAFAVHVLGSAQEDLAMRFATRSEDKFAGLDTIEGYRGVPLLTHCAAHFECVTEERFQGGDHLIFLGRVVRFEQCDHDPLIFHQGRFGRVAQQI
ncbi:MAG: flavin reductase family protein [Sphingomonas sp.]